MGFFKKITKAVKKVVVKPIAKVIKPATKVAVKPITATAQRAISVVTAKKPVLAAGALVKDAALGVTGLAIGQGVKAVYGEKGKAAYEKLYFTVGGAVAGVYGGVAAGLAAKAVTSLAEPTIGPPGGQKMGLDLGGILKTVGGIFGGNQNQYFNAISNVANTASQFIPAKQPVQSLPMPTPIPTMAAAAPAMRAVGAVVARGFFSKFPNLAVKIQKYRNMGMNVTRGKLYSMMRRFGPEFLVTAGILTAVEINELALAGSGRRRMNPGNTKALRRSMRRLESFHKLCVSADKLRRPRARRTAKC